MQLNNVALASPAVGFALDVASLLGLLVAVRVKSVPADPVPVFIPPPVRPE